MLIVSHYLEEVLELVDRVTILRDGQHIVTEDATGHTPQSLVRLMVGREVAFLIPDVPKVPSEAETVVRVAGLSSAKVKDISLEVRRGEILGIAGLVGSGRSETLLAIFGQTGPPAATSKSTAAASAPAPFEAPSRPVSPSFQSPGKNRV